MDNTPAPEFKRRVQKIKGVSYVYEDHPYWDPEKRQARHKRVYLGKLDGAGRFVPSKTYQAGLSSNQAMDAVLAQARRRYYGAGYLLSHVGQATGVERDLAACFPDICQEVLSLVYFLVLEGESAVYRFAKWGATHWHPCGEPLTSQRTSVLFGMFGEDGKMDFFRRQARRRVEKEYLAYDTTSISSYSQLIKQAKYGLNKDDDLLPQINLAMVFGEKSGLPVYFRKLPGNMPDVKTVQKLLADVAFLNFSKVKLVMDRGFYSAGNIDSLYQRHYKFIVGMRSDVKLANECLEAARPGVTDYANYLPGEDIYCSSTTGKWEYKARDKKGRVTETGERRAYFHVYYNETRAAEERADFNRTLAALELELMNDSLPEEHKKAAERYFTVHETPVRGRRVTCNDDAVRNHTRNFGFFVLMTNDAQSGQDVLRSYRNKDLVEKTFCNLKNRLYMKRTMVSSAENLEGKLFVEFLALIYLAYIHKVMKDNDLYKNYSIQSMLDELDIIERFEYPGHRPHCGEMTKRQKDLFDAFKVPHP